MGASKQATIADPHDMVTAMMDTLRARYGLAPVGGRPDELISPSTTGPTGLARSVSVSYGCRTIRVRLHADRRIIRTEDFQLHWGQQDRLYGMCDTYFDYRGDGSTNAHLRLPQRPRTEVMLSIPDLPVFNHPNTGKPLTPRPIRDNPQA